MAAFDRLEGKGRGELTSMLARAYSEDNADV